MLAYLVGYEVWGELTSREENPVAGKGWHPTSALGIIGATAAVGHLNKLDPVNLRHALGIAASLASGVVANFGTMTKPLHAGHASSSAIRAVRLASMGFTSTADAIEHAAGLLAALSPKGKLDLVRASELGKKFRIRDVGLSFKKYPNCYSTHRVIDAVIDLARDNGLKPADVKGVHATIGKSQEALCKNHDPVTALQAKYSLEFAVASALVAGNVGLTQLDDKFVNLAEVRETMKKVSYTAIDSTCPIEPAFAVSDRVVIDLADGRRLDSGEVQFARGHALKPMATADMERKFLDCAASSKYENAPRLLQSLQVFESLADVSAIGKAVAAAA
jgi:aconitate decarboxylase